MKGCSFSARACLVLLFSWFLLPGSDLQAQRQMESLGRGMIALRTSSTQTYIGWRLLGNDPEDLGFNLYRSANGAAPVKLNSTPLTTTTNYVDTPGSLSTTAYTYSLKTVLNGVEVADTWANPLSAPATLAVNAPARQYIPLPLTPTPDDPTTNANYRVKLAWVGDLDGDGEYDFVVERTRANADAPGTGQQWIQAYKRNGTLLWQMTQGPNSIDQDNIYLGSSTIATGQADNVTVYDLDGDGKAEVVVLTANGVIFNYGKATQATLTAANDEVQYISIIDGETGVEKARAPVPIPPGWQNQNHVTGNMGIVYADGLRPSIYFHAKNRNDDLSFNNLAATWDYRNGVASLRYLWTPAKGEHHAEGHQLRLADVNNDGLDEYVDIGLVLKADGSGQINPANFTEVVHGDRYHVTDIDPDRPGLETFLIQQNNPTGLTMALHAADKSSLVKKWYAGSVIDVGRGTVGGFLPNVFGLQLFSTVGGTFDCKGNEVVSEAPFPPETIWWDADLLREFINSNGVAIDKFTSTGGLTRLLTIYNDSAAPTGNTQADGGRPAFWGDILGDWREELVCVASDYSELRIYTTKTADVAKTFSGQNFRIPTLMHDPQYRIQTTTKGYVQSSYPSYYLGYNMPPPPPPPMVDARLVWKGGSGSTVWDAGTTASWLNKGTASLFATGDTVRFDLSGDNSTTVTLNGTLQPGAMTVYNPKDYTFAGIGTLAGTMKLMKAGGGAMILPGTHTFTGKTTVWDGALVVNGNLASSPVTVWGGTWGGAAALGLTGGRVAGTGQFGQPVTIRYRGAITPGTGMNNAGTLTFANGLTVEDGSTLALDLSSDPTGASKPSDRVAVTGNLTLSGTVSVVINPLNGQLTAGTYTLATYTGTLTGGTANLNVILPAGTPYTMAAGSGSIRLTIPTTRAVGAVTWRGSGAAWDIAASSNWLKNGTPDVFVSGDTVTFDETGAASAAVNLTTQLPVGGMVISGAANYTFAGTGSITGTGGLTKSGAGVLTISTANSYTGPTAINGGTIAVATLGDAGNPGSLGASAAEASNLILDGGTLRLSAAQTNTNRNLTLGAGGGIFDITAAGSSIQISGAIGGSGMLTKNGPGTLLLASANTYTGGTVINGGKLYLAGAVANAKGLGSGTVTLNNSTLSMADVRGSESAEWNIVVPAGSVSRIDADGRCVMKGTLTGAGTLTLNSPYVRTDMTGNWSAFTGQIITEGEFRIANSFGYAMAGLQLGAASTAYYNLSMSGNLSMGLGDLSGAADAALSGGPTSGRTLTWQIGGKNTDSVFAGTIRNGTGLTALTKVGTGSLTLSGASTYTGATLVSGGKLALLGGSLSGTNVAVSSGAGFGGNGTVTGNVTFSSGAVLLTNPGGGPLAVTGDLTFGGAVTVSPAAGASLAEGSYPLYTYSGALTGTPEFTWKGAGFTASFDTSVAGQVSVTLVALPRDPADLRWTGAQSTTWDGSTKNWAWSLGATNFMADDRVRFDDTVSIISVSLAGRLAPAAMVVDSTQAYVFSGGGTWSGNGTLTKAGTGTLTITPGVVSVSTTLTSGSTTATVTSASGLEVGMTVSSGTGLTAGTTIAAISGTSLTLSQAATAAGTAVRTYTAIHSFAGGTMVSGGTLALGNPTANGSGLGTGPVKLNGGTLRLFAYSAAGTSVGTFSNALQVDAGFTGNLIGFGRGTLASKLSGGGTLNYQTNYVRAEVTGDWSEFTGQVNVTEGPDGGDFRMTQGTSPGLNMPGGRLNLGSDVTMSQTYTPAGGTGAETLHNIGELSGAATATLSGNPIAGRFATWRVGALNTDATFAGRIVNGTGASRLTKLGTGALTLSGASTYTGQTLVSGGALYVTGSLGVTAVTAFAGTTVGGSGSVGGSLALATGARLALGVGATATKGLAVAGTATLTGDITVVPALLGGTLAPGTYTLLTYSGTLAGAPRFTWLDTTASGYKGTFDTNTSGKVLVTLTKSVAAPAAPTGLAATAGNGQAGLSWNASSGATSYAVQRSLSSGSGFTTVASGLTALSYTDTAVTNGTMYYYTVTATGTGGASSPSTEASARPVQTFAQWTTAAFGGQTDAAVIGWNADPDRDGYSNLAEYFYGTSPTVAKVAAGVSCAPDGQGNLVMTFPMSQNLTGVTWSVQQSGDLSTWTPVSVTPVVGSPQDGVSQVKVTVPMQTEVKMFLRLVITGS